jgi:CRISPR-associated endonuclease/helicase Cas3
MLCIVNSRAHARRLFEAIRDLPGAAHLTTLMCPRHRRTVLATLRVRLARGEPVRLVATSLIEAGVDIDFPEVWRASTGLDSIAQAAGRCNREGRMDAGRVVVFTPAEKRDTPKIFRPNCQATVIALEQHGEEPLGLEAVRSYFCELYQEQKGTAALDAAMLDGKPWPILQHLSDHGRECTFDFDSIARAFRMIDEVMAPVVVPWSSGAGDDEAERLLEKVGAMDRPLAADLRALQQYVVSVPYPDRAEWLERGAVRPVHTLLGEALLCFEDLAHYREETGLDTGDMTWRDAEMNIIA